MGVNLPQLLAAEARRGRGSKDDVSVIILFLHGGLSTIDTVDLKPNAPVEIRGEFNPIATNVPGIQVCEHLPHLARHADKFSLIRSFAHGDSSHGSADHYMLTGYRPRAGFNSGLSPNNQWPSHGSVIARKLGPRLGDSSAGAVPPYVCLPKMHPSAGSAYLGASASPFVIEADPNAPGFSVPDLVPPLSLEANRLDARRALLTKVDRFQQAAEREANDQARTVSVFREKAFAMMTSPQAKAAFDIASESTATRDRYGRTSLGQSCLMARRLVEAGVRCVTIDHSNWDTHDNNFNILKNELLPAFDQGLSALLADLADRGLLERTLVIVTGEFGRTPRINKNAGRDHWGPAFTVMVGGGGVQGGRVVGASDSKGAFPLENPKTPQDVLATIYRHLGVDTHVQYLDNFGRPLSVLPFGSPIDELF